MRLAVTSSSLVLSVRTLGKDCFRDDLRRVEHSLHEVVVQASQNFVENVLYISVKDVVVLEGEYVVLISRNKQELAEWGPESLQNSK